MKYLFILLSLILIGCTNLSNKLLSLNNNIGGKINFYENQNCSIETIINSVNSVDSEFTKNMINIDTTDSNGNIVFRGCSIFTDSEIIMIWENGLVTVVPYVIENETPEKNKSFI